MGNCINKKADPELNRAILFNESVDIRIKTRDMYGKPCGSEKVSFKITHPIHRLQEHFRIGSSLLSVSGAILPGLDPRKMINKECQDLYFISVK